MSDLDLIVGAAREAGGIALRHFQSADLEVTQKPGDAGPVTEADLAVDRYLSDHLTGERPDYGWLSEETEDDQTRLETERQFIVDPIDGTRAFIDGARDWGVSIGIADRGRITAAAVYLPARDLLFSAALGSGAAKNGVSIQCSPRAEIDGATILAAKPNLAPDNWRGGTPPVARHFRSSLAYRLCLVAEGRFDGMMTLRPSWEWDIAGGSLIAAEAGAALTDRRGKTLVFNGVHPKTDGVLAAGPPLHQQLVSRLRTE
ncbi:inositol monophosphatase family protein [Aestuariibius sp. 2305UL40-4]|uniref:inositol monophosphatase family protein n=1 Tax=Aestuariibius violaceus TaxID=3234132 RepID=UPI00345E6C3A